MRALGVLLLIACSGQIGGLEPPADSGTPSMPGPDGGVADSGMPAVVDAGLAVVITAGPSSPTRETMPSFSFEGTGAVAFECSMDELVGGPIEPCGSPRWYGPLADGNHAFRVRAIDAQGTRSAVALLRFDVDTAAPTVTITGSGPPSYGFTGSEPGCTFECRVDAAAFASCTSPFAVSGAGAHAFEVKATDAAGNVGPVARASWSSGALTLIGPTFVIPTTAGQVRHAAVAHDPAHDLYGVVYGNSRIGVTCITPDGAAAGAPLTLSQTTQWTQSPWVAYSAQADVFLAAWFDTRLDPNRPAVYARLFRCAAGGAAAVGTDFQVNADGNFADPRNQLAVAYSPASQVFLVAWPQQLVNRRMSVLAQRVSTAGALLGGAITVMPERDWYEAVKLTYVAATDELVAIAATVASSPAVSIQRVRADGSLQGSTVEVVSGLSGAWTPQVVETGGELFAAWFQGSLQAARVSTATGLALAAPFPFAPGYGAAEGLHLAVSGVTGSLLAVFHGTTAEDWGQLLTASGPRGMPMEVTQSPAGTSGNFDPRVIAHPTRREWLVVSSRNFTTLVGQRLGE